MKITTAVELDLNLLDGLDGVDVREHPAYVSPALRDSLAALNSGTISEEQFAALKSKDMYAENGFTFDTLSHPVLHSVVSERHGKDGSYSSLHQGLSPVGEVAGVYKVMSVTSHDGSGADIDYHSDADITYMAVDGKSVANALHVFSWNVSGREVDGSYFIKNDAGAYVFTVDAVALQGETLKESYITSSLLHYFDPESTVDDGLESIQDDFSSCFMDFHRKGWEHGYKGYPDICDQSCTLCSFENHDTGEYFIVVAGAYDSGEGKLLVTGHLSEESLAMLNRDLHSGFLEGSFYEFDDLMDLAHSSIEHDDHTLLVPQVVGVDKMYRNERDDVMPDMNFVPGEKSLPYLRNASIIHSSFDESFGFMARDMVHEFSEGKTLQQFFEEAITSIREHTTDGFQKVELAALNELTNGVMTYEKGLDKRFDFIEEFDEKQAARGVEKEKISVEVDMSDVGKNRSGDKSKDKGR